MVASALQADEVSWLASFEHDPRVKVMLFASEPQVIDPVALCFPPDGTCLVVEMRDYPLGLGDGKGPGGRIRRLRDTNGDGRADESVVFAEGLSYPTSITPWRGGVLVAAPPEIIYLEDADGDGVAETRRTVAAGFPLGVTDSNFNGLRFGPDGRIHGVNAGNAGRITSPLAPQTAPVDLGRLDFSSTRIPERWRPRWKRVAGLAWCLTSGAARSRPTIANSSCSAWCRSGISTAFPRRAGWAPSPHSLRATAMARDCSRLATSRRASTTRNRPGISPRDRRRFISGSRHSVRSGNDRF